jgi:hypothetical protein
MSGTPSLKQLVDQFDAESAPEELSTSELVSAYGDAATIRGYTIALRQAATAADGSNNEPSPTLGERIRQAWNKVLPSELNGQNSNTKRTDSFDEAAAELIDAADAVDERTAVLEEVLETRLEPEESPRGFY